MKRTIVFLSLLLSITHSFAGSISVVEFLDLACPHCRHMEPVMNQLEVKNPQLHFVYRIIPAFGERSLFVDSALLASRYQGMQKSEHFERLIFSPLPRAVLQAAKQAHLNIQTLISDMHKPAVMHELKTNWKAYEQTGATHIPLVLIGYSNSKSAAFVTVGEQPEQKLQKAINELEENPHG